MNEKPTNGEIIKIISELNDEFDSQTDFGNNHILRPFVFETCGDEGGIKFLGNTLWTSDLDEREEGESLSQFPSSRANQICKTVGMAFLGLPELSNSKPVILYFKTDEDRDGFIAEVKAYMPNLSSRKL